MGKNGILFCMRYPDDQGFVWKNIAHVRDLIAGELQEYQCYISFPKLTKNSVHNFKNLSPVEIDCYHLTKNNQAILKRFISDNNIKSIVYMSAMTSTLDMSFIRSLNIATINTENDSYDHRNRDSFFKKTAKFVVRRILRRQLHSLHIANAASQEQWLLSHAQIPRNRLIAIPDGVDCTYFTPLADHAVQHLDPKFKWVICASQARAEKRVDWIIRAAADLMKQPEYADIAFVYVGDGPMLDQWKEQAKAFHLDDRFLFAGQQSDLRKYYQSSCLMVHASERESFGLVLVEAMACGLPVVACAAAGPQEIIIDGQTGALVPLQDEERFLQAIKYYLQNPQIAKDHGSAGRKRATEKFSVQRQARDMAVAIREVTNSV